MSNAIHPTAILTGDVHLGSGNTIGPFVVVTGPVVIGNDNWIGAGAVIGAPPEVRSFAHPRDPEESSGAGITVGDRNVIREYAQVHHGWSGKTTIADDAFIMNQAYVAHDCQIGSGVTLASSVLLAGHVSIAESANLGLAAAVHQRVRLGAGTMIGMGAVVTRDVPPFAKAFGNPARVRGANSVGMERLGLPAPAIEAVVAAYGGAAGSWDLGALEAVEGIRSYFESWNAPRG